MYNGKKVLVTGGTGLVGREMVELLVKAGADVTSVSMDENNFPNDWGVNYVKADLRDASVCNKYVKGKDFVFHIAGIKGSPVVVKTKPYVFFTSFIQMNTNMIAAMNHSDTMEWGLYTSTVGTYGPAQVFKESELWEQMPSLNDWYAGWSKRMGEVQVDAWQLQTGERRISVIKPVNIYGKYDNFDLRTSTLIPSLVRKVYEAEDKIDVWGKGDAKRDIIHAKDVARAAAHVVNQKYDKPINIGNGRAVSVLEVVQTAIKVSGKDLEIVHDLSKPTGDAYRVADISRLNSTGFESIVDLEEGIADTYNWYKENPNYQGRFDPFHTIDYTNKEA